LTWQTQTFGAWQHMLRMSPNSGPKRLRELLKQPGIIRSLGAHDVFTALIVEQAGAVRRMAARVCIPVIADGDTGYGDLHNVQRTVEAFEVAGASGILLEDQVMPKRCGHLANKRVIPSEEMVLKIKAAVKARSDLDFVILARTDARQMNGLDDAIDRVNRCCDSGADIAFIEAPESCAELEEIPKRVKHPMFVNMLTGGGDADSVGERAGATGSQDSGLPHRIADGPPGPCASCARRGRIPGAWTSWLRRR